MRKQGAVLGVIGLALLVSLVGNLAKPVQTAAATSNTVNFQARLMTNTGSIVPDGNYNIEFKLYDASSGGTLLWTGDDYNNNSHPVTVTNGYMSVYLGAENAFPTSINWDRQLWVTMNVGGTTTGTPTLDGEMSPRLQLSATPYSFTAGQLALQTGANESTLGWATQTTANSLLLPNEGGTLCVRNSANCGFATGSGTAFLQGGNSFSAQGVLGTNDGNSLAIRTNNVNHLVVDTSGNLQFQQASTLNVVSAATGTQLTIQGGAATSGTNVGGNLLLQGGAGASTGVSGSVIVKPTGLDSTTAFQIQNAAGTSLLSADTVNSILSTGGDLNVGTTYGNRLFTDGFESGSFFFWPTNTGLTIDSTRARNGKYSAKEAAGVYAAAPIQTSTTVDFRSWVYITSNVNTTFILHLYTTGNAESGLYLDPSNHLCFWNSGTGAAAGCSSGSVSTGVWHLVEGKITANTTTGSLQWWLDGSSVLSSTGINTGSAGFNRVVIGDTASRAATINYDDVSVDTSATNTPSSSLNVSDSLHVSGTSTFGNSIYIQPATDTTTAFQIQNAAVTGPVFDVDTSNGRVGVGTAAPSWTFDIQGNTTGALVSNIRNINAGTGAVTELLFGNNSTTTASALFQGSSTFLPYGGANSLNLINLLNASLTLGTNNAVRLVLDGSGNLQFQQASTLNAVAAASGTQLTVAAGAANSGTNVGGNLLLQGGAGASTGASGSVIVQSNGNNSTTAFQVQNAAAAPVLVVDTTSTAANGNTLNYLTYPGFESGSFSNAAAGWAAVSPATLSQNSTKLHAYNGLYSAQVTTTVSNGGLTTSSFIATPASGTYLVSFYAKVSSGTMASTAFTVQTTDGATHTCSPAAGITINANGFQRLFCSITATGNITALQIIQNDATARTIYIDAVQLQSNSFNSTTITAPTAYQIGSIQLRGVISNPVTLLGNSNSTTAFQVQDAVANTLLNVDTLNDTVSLGSNGSQALASTVNIATTTGSAIQTVKIGSNANVASTTTIQGGNGAGAIALTPQTTGTIVIGATAGTGQVTVGSSTGAQTVVIGNGTGASTVSIANNVATATGNTVNIAGGATATGLADTVNIATGNTAGTGAKVVHIADGTPAGTGSNTVTIGSTANASSVTLQGGSTGAINLNAATIQGNAASINLFNTTATTINLGGAAATFNIGPTGATATSINLAGGSGATGCTVDGVTGNLTCTGNISGGATGTQGYWSRSGTTLQPATAGDAITTSGNISTTGSGTLAVAGTSTLTGDLILASSSRTYSLTRTLPTTVGNEVDIGSFGATFGANSFHISVVVSDNSFSVAKEYVFPVQWNQTANTWQIVQPISDTGPYGGQDFTLEVNSNNGTTSFRLRRSAGTTAGTARITIVQEGSNLDTFTVSSATSAVSAPTVIFGSTPLTQTTGGAVIARNSSNSATAFQVQNAAGTAILDVDTSNKRIGIGNAAPAYALDVTGTGADTARIGTTLVGTWPAASGYAFFGNQALNQTAAGNYALVQDTSGSTYLNAASGQSINFQINNVAVGGFYNGVGFQSLVDTYVKDTSTTAFQVQNAGGAQVLIVDTTDKNIGIATSINTSLGLLQVGPSTTGVAGAGITFGQDVNANLYRSAASTLKTDGNLLVKPANNSTAAFQIQNAAATSVFTADTSNRIINALDTNVGSAANVGGAGHLFSDSFESGNFNLWNGGFGGSGLSVQSATVRNGKYAVKQNQTGSPSNAYTPFTSSPTVYVRAWVNLSSRSTDDNILSLYGPSSSITTLYWENSTGKLCIYNEVAGGVAACTAGAVSTGTWHLIEFTGTIATSTTGVLGLSVDGTPAFTTITTANNGSTNYSQILIGDSNSRTATWYLDDLSVDTVSNGDSASLYVQDSLHVSGTTTLGGETLIQPAANTTTAFQIQNAAGSSNLLVADTANSKIGIRLSPSSSGDTLQVGAGGLSVADSGFTARLDNAVGLQVETTGSAAYTNLGTSGSADIVDFYNNANASVGHITSTGAVLFKNSTDSTAAFQIQNAAGTNILSADTTTLNLTVGNSTIPTAVQEWDAHGTSQSTVAVAPHTVGNLMALAINSDNAAVTVASVSGGGVTNWKMVDAITGAGTREELWEGTVTTTGASTITVTYSSTPGVTCEIAAQEFTAGLGSNTNWSVAVSGHISNASSTTVTYPSLTATQAGQLYWGYSWISNTSSAGSTPGFSYLATGNTNYITYNTNTAAGSTYSPTAAESPAGTSAGVAMIIGASVGSALTVNNGFTVTGDAAIQGGSLGVAGGANFTGSVMLSGGNNFIFAPTISGVTWTGTTGTNTTWSYVVTSVNASGGESKASATGTISSGDGPSLDATHTNTISWGAVSGAATYKIYRTAHGTTPSTNGLIGSTTGTSFVDTGFTGDGSSSPAFNETGQLTVQGSVLFRNSSDSTGAFILNTAGNTNLLVADTTDQAVLIGPNPNPVTANAITLSVGKNYGTINNGNTYVGQYNLFSGTGQASSTSGLYGIFSQASTSGSTPLASIQGVVGQAYSNASATVNVGVGFSGSAAVASSGSIQNGWAFYAQNTTTSGSTGGIVSSVDYFADSPVIQGSGTITTQYGLYVGQQKRSGVTGTGYGIYQAGANDQNYFAGSLTAGMVTDSFTDAGTTTHNDTTNSASAFYIKTSSGTSSTSFTSTVNLTNLPAVDGTIAFFTVVADKGTSAGSATHTTTLQINGTTISSIQCGGGISPSTIIHNFIVARMNGVWSVMGTGLTTGNSNVTSTLNTADYAEWVHYSGDSQPQPGEVLTVGDSGISVKRSDSAYDQGLMGVVSTSPYQVGGADDGHAVVIALIGRVPVKVSLENGPIHRGDYLTSSSMPGVAMKATRPGNVIGTALEDYDGTQSDNKIAVQLHNGYADPTRGQLANNVQGNLAVAGGLNLTGSAAIGGDLNVSGNASVHDLAVTGNATISGTLTVAQIKVTDIEIDGHVITAGGQPVATVQAAAGQHDPHNLNGQTPAVTINGNDTSGTITITTGDATAAGDLANIAFSKVYGAAPRILISGQDGRSAASFLYPANKSANGFELHMDAPPAANATYVFDYFVVQ